MTDKALCVFASGARGTGKTAFVRQLLRQQAPARLIVWDFKHDPALRDLGTPHVSLPNFVRAMKAPTFCLRFLPSHGANLQREFEYFCEAAWAASRLTMFVDELPEVTTPSRAPPAWRRCVNVGRLYRAPDGRDGFLSVIAAAQRPAECDKSIFGNADILHTGRLQFRTDCMEMSKLLDVPAQELMHLPDLHWIERRQGVIEPLRGVLSFSRTAAKKSAPAKTKRKAA